MNLNASHSIYSDSVRQLQIALEDVIDQIEAVYEEVFYMYGNNDIDQTIRYCMRIFAKYREPLRNYRRNTPIKSLLDRIAYLHQEVSAWLIDHQATNLANQWNTIRRALDIIRN